MSSSLLEHNANLNLLSGQPKFTGESMFALDGVRPAAGWHHGADGSTNLGPSVFDPSCYYNTKYPSDQSLSLALQAAYSGNALLGVTWVNDLSMMQWARAVMCYYNRDIPAPSNGTLWASRSDLYFFDAAVKYFKRFNYKYQFENADCYVLQESSTGIDNERTNILQQRAAGSLGTGEEGVYLTILKDLQSNIDNVLAQLSCTQYVNNDQQQQAADSLQSQLQNATSLTSTDKTATYVIGGIILLMAGIAVYILVKD